MKNIFFVLLSMICLNSFAQISRDYELVKLASAVEAKAAEPFVLEASTYILGVPFASESKNRNGALNFIVKWMNLTPDHPFVIDEAAKKLLRGNDDLVGLYLAAVAKYSLNSKDSAKDQKVLKLNAVTQVLDYVENPKNNMRMTKQLKKLSKARTEGKLEEAL